MIGKHGSFSMDLSRASLCTSYGIIRYLYLCRNSSPSCMFLNYKIPSKLLFIREFRFLNSIRLRNPAEFGSVKEFFIIRMHAPLRNSTENIFMQIYKGFFFSIVVQQAGSHRIWIYEGILHGRACFEITKFYGNWDLCREYFPGTHIGREIRN